MKPKGEGLELESLTELETARTAVNFVAGLDSLRTRSRLAAQELAVKLGQYAELLGNAVNVEDQLSGRANRAVTEIESRFESTVVVSSLELTAAYHTDPLIREEARDMLGSYTTAQVEEFLNSSGREEPPETQA